MITTQKILFTLLCLGARNDNGIIAFQIPSTSVRNGRPLTNRRLGGWSRRSRWVQLQMSTPPPKAGEPMWYQYAKLGKWQELLDYCESHPEDAQYIYEHTGWTALHNLASQTAPWDVDFRHVEANNEAYHQSPTVESEKLKDNDSVGFVSSDGDDTKMADIKGGAKYEEYLQAMSVEFEKLNGNDSVEPVASNADGTKTADIEREEKDDLVKACESLRKEVDGVRIELQSTRRLLESTKEYHEADRKELRKLLEERHEEIIILKKKLDDSADEKASMIKGLDDAKASIEKLSATNTSLQSKLNAIRSMDWWERDSTVY